MRTIQTIAILLLALLIASTGCRRKDKGGKGGNAVLKVTPQHHGANIGDCVIYLKYDAQTPPASLEGYDENIAVVIENGKPVATFTGLRNGKYYIYGQGYDPNVAQDVKGGIPYEIKAQETISVNVPVTEGD